MSVSPRRFSVWTILLAFAVGVGGTAALMSRRQAPPTAGTAANSTNEEKTSPKSDAGPITLSMEARATAGIRVEPARFLVIGESMAVPGTVEVSPNREARITPPVPGKIARLLANPGDTVRAGQPLAVLDSFEVAQAEAANRQAASNVDQARATLQTARAEVARSQAVVSGTRAELQQARTKQASAQIALQRQKDLAAAGAFSQAPLQTAQSELADSQSTLLRAQTDLQVQTSAYDRAQRLFKAELVSRSELEQAQAEKRKDEAEVAHAQERVRLAKQAVAREQKVFQGDLLSKQAVQTAEADVRVAQGDILKAMQTVRAAEQEALKSEREEQAAGTALRGTQSALATTRANRAALAGMNARGSLLTMTAPIGGVITDRKATLGEAVERSMLLFVIQNLGTVMVLANVPEQEVAHVRVGQPVEVSVPAYPGNRFPGVVQSMAGSVDEKTRALPVRCLVENRGGRLRPEMFARVLLGVGARTPALAVPTSALDQDGNETYVYVDTGGGFERRKVSVGRASGSLSEIASGLKAGERVAVAGVFVLKSEGKKSELKGDD
jgi:cobalt-zinc-cadmium efflux system membrane fusion protein